MSDFSGIENATSTARLPAIRPGLYTMEVLSFKIVNSRAKGKMFIGEFKVLEAAGANSNEVGTTCSQVIKMSLDSALGNIKSVAAAVSGEPEKNITAQMCDALVSDKNPAKGVKVKAEASLTKTKAGNDFTLVKWSAVEAPKKK